MQKIERRVTCVQSSTPANLATKMEDKLNEGWFLMFDKTPPQVFEDGSYFIYMIREVPVDITQTVDIQTDP